MSFGRFFEVDSFSDDLPSAATVALFNSRYFALLKRVQDRWAIEQLELTPMEEKLGLIYPMMMLSVPGEGLPLWRLDEHEWYTFQNCVEVLIGDEMVRQLDIGIENEFMRATIRSTFDALGRLTKSELLAQDAGSLIGTVNVHYHDEQSPFVSKYLYDAGVHGTRVYEFENYQKIAHDDSQRAWLSYYGLPEPEHRPKKWLRPLLLATFALIVLALVLGVWRWRRTL